MMIIKEKKIYAVVLLTSIILTLSSNAALATMQGPSVLTNTNSSTDNLTDSEFKIDWSTLKVRFFGKGTPSSTNEDYKAIEQRAWANGVTFAQLNAKKLISKYIPTQTDTKDIQAKLIKNIRSIRTEYFSSGSVKVHLEGSLGPILASNSLNFKPSSTANKDESTYSGLILRGQASVEPRPFYKIVNEAGHILFSISDVTQKAFKDNLMGRWFKNSPSRKLLTTVVGTSPVSLTYTIDEKGQFVVQGKAWQEATSSSRYILENAKIAIVYK
ncbi:MAG: hypothetical protein R3B45_00755 [Bdellovibrionota bacterium]